VSENKSGASTMQVLRRFCLCRACPVWQSLHVQPLGCRACIALKVRWDIDVLLLIRKSDGNCRSVSLPCRPSVCTIRHPEFSAPLRLFVDAAVRSLCGQRI